MPISVPTQENKMHLHSIYKTGQSKILRHFLQADEWQFKSWQIVFPTILICKLSQLEYILPCKSMLFWANTDSLNHSLSEFSLAPLSQSSLRVYNTISFYSTETPRWRLW